MIFKVQRQLYALQCIELHWRMRACEYTRSTWQTLWDPNSNTLPAPILQVRASHWGFIVILRRQVEAAGGNDDKLWGQLGKEIDWLAAFLDPCSDLEPKEGPGALCKRSSNSKMGRKPLQSVKFSSITIYKHRIQVLASYSEIWAILQTKVILNVFRFFIQSINIFLQSVCDHAK